MEEHGSLLGEIGAPLAGRSKSQGRRNNASRISSILTPNKKSKEPVGHGSHFLNKA